MKRITVRSLESGIILGQVIEVLIIDGSKEYVVQNKSGRFFLRHDPNKYTVSN